MNALFVSVTEFAGGILLIAGIGHEAGGSAAGTGYAGGLHRGLDREALASIFSDPSPFAKADPFPFLCAAVVALVFGAGVASADYLLAAAQGRSGYLRAWRRLPERGRVRNELWLVSGVNMRWIDSRAGQEQHRMLVAKRLDEHAVRRKLQAPV